MKPILALSGIALVLVTHSAQADPTRPLDPHERARQLITSTTPSSISTRSVVAGEALTLTDPHELARQRILASHVVSSAPHPLAAMELQLTVAPQERARSMILGAVGGRL